MGDDGEASVTDRVGMQFGELMLRQCKYGWMLFSGPYIGKCFELYGQYSESEISLMRAFLREGATVIDVGANIGDLTVPLAKIVGPTGRVYAIESHPQNFNVLCANLALNSLTNTKALNVFVATSDKVSTGGVWGEFAYVSESWKPQFMAIDALEMDACDLIKVDVDGKELDVLQSGEMQIERFRPIIYFENDDRASSPALISYMTDALGYELYWHPAPIFDESNFLNNPVNHWAPKNIVSQMVLAIPPERKTQITNLRRVTGSSDWWQ